MIKKYYKKHVEKNTGNEQTDFLYQVGKTYAGKPIDNDKFLIIIESIVKNLKINKKDTVIDLGSANGLITYNISKLVKSIHGFDFSKDLVYVANKYHKEENTHYTVSNILDIDFTSIPFQKIYMYEVLQHFEYNMLRQLLNKLIDSRHKFSFFIGSIPDAAELFTFYSNEERKKYYFTEILEKNQFHLGNWWHKEQIILLCKELNLNVNIINHHKDLHTAHYRFDVLIEKK